MYKQYNIVFNCVMSYQLIFKNSVMYVAPVRCHLFSSKNCCNIKYIPCKVEQREPFQN